MSFSEILRSKWYRPLLLSYLGLVCAAVCIVSVVFFTLQLSALDQKHSEQTSASARAMEEYHRLAMAHVENLSLIIQFDEMTESISSPAGLAQDALKSYNFMSMLSSVQLSSELINSVWVMDMDHLQVYSSSRTRLSTADPLVAGHLPLVNNPAWLPARMINQRGTTGQQRTSLPCVTYVRPIRRTSEHSAGYIYMNVSVDVLLQQLKQVSGFEDLMILDADGQILLSSLGDEEQTFLNDNAPLLTKLIYAGDTAQSSGRVAGSGERVIAMRGDHYLYIASRSADVGELRATAVYAFAITLVFLVIGAALCILISRRVYNPLSQLAQNYEDRSAAHPVSEDDDSIIRQTLSTLSRDLPVAEEPANDEDEDIFEQLLRNEYPTGMATKLESFDHFVILVGEIDEPAHQGASVQLLQRFFEKLLRYFLRTILKPGESSYTIDLREGLSAAAIRLESPDRYQDMDALAERLQQLLYSVSPHTTSFAWSNLYSGEENLSRALVEAQRALQHKIRLGLGQRIVFTEDMNKPSSFVFPQAQVQQLFALIDNGSLEQLQSTYRQLMDELMQGNADDSDLQLVLHQLLSQVIQTMLRRKISASNIFTEPDISPYKYLNSFDTLEHMADWLWEKLSLLYTQRGDMQPGGSMYINAFQRYMHENYMQHLDPEEVAAHLGISYSYMRKLLQSELGTTFSAYLMSLRLHYTRHLLVNTTLSQREIAEQVGFGSEQTLYRVFRQREGCSPGEYRKNHPAQTADYRNTTPKNKEDAT